MNNKVNSHHHPVLYYDSEALAAHLGFSAKTLKRWRAEGYGPPYIKIGALVRYSVEAVDKWLADQTHPPRPGIRGIRPARKGGV